MRTPLKLALMALVTLLLLSGIFFAAFVRKEMQAEAVPGFSVNVTLTNRARDELSARGETILVIAHFNGSSNEKGRWIASKTGSIRWSPHQQIELKAEGEAVFGPRKLSKFKRDRMNSPNLLINIVSGRKSAELNLLSCDIFEGSIYEAAKQPIRLNCDLIE